jgi:uroporphyrin-III C-methyltransferase/precorrin-2 dehydrogenase/sirohydrochlorin ferrochelatase
LQKTRLVAAAGAHPTIIWPEIDPALRAEFADSASIIEAAPARADLNGATLVFVAVESELEASRWAREAKAAGCLVNVVDRPALCDFTTPSIVDRGRLAVAISTGGAGPVFAKALREKIEALIPARADALLAFADSYRARVKANVPEAERRRFWERFFSGSVAAAVLADDVPTAHELMRESLDRSQTEEKTGVVHIVGAGPGDPELLTLKALRVLQSADAIVYDRLVSDDILALARRDADRIYVGKAKANHSVPQDKIETQMIALAREGKIVVRLKGGDPFIFGRGGEELDAVRAAGVPAYVVPGITAATGCAAATGMALTHRDHAQAVTFVTGHAKGDADPDLDWAALAALQNTLVVYMGVGKAGAIADNLIAHGRAASTPVAVVENGTRNNQLILKGTLNGLASLIESGGVKGPALLVIGEIAQFAEGAGLIDLVNHERNAA